jgi:hypothetical protein
MELFSRAILDELEAFHSEHAQGPTASELARRLGIPFEFGHDHVVARVKRQIVLGRVCHSEGRFTLTSAGREAVGREAVRR